MSSVPDLRQTPFKPPTAPLLFQIRLFLSLLTVLVSPYLLAAAPADSTPNAIIAQAYFSDPAGTLSFEEVRNQNFTPYEGALSLKYSAGASWIRLRLDPSVIGDSERLVLHNRPPNLQDEIALFDPGPDVNESDAVIQPRYSGDRCAFRPGDYHSVNPGFVLQAGHQPRNVYLRLKTTSIHHLDLGAYPTEVAWKMDMRQIVVTVLVLGFLVSILGWAIMIMWQDPEWVMGILIVKMLLSIAHIFLGMGLGRFFLPEWLGKGWLDEAYNGIYTFVTATTLFFHLAFLREFRPPVWLWRSTAALLSINIAAIALLLTGHTSLALQWDLAAIVLFPFPLLILALNGRVWRDHPEQAPYLLPRWIVVFHQTLVLLVSTLPTFMLLGVEQARFLTNGIFVFAYTLVTSGFILILLHMRYVQREKARRAAFTEMTRVQEQIREQARLLLEEDYAFQQRLIDSIPGIFCLADPEGRILRWNQDLQALQGLDNTGMSTLNLIDTVAPDQRDSMRETIERVFNEGQVTMEAALISRTGHCTLPFFLTAYRLEWHEHSSLLGIGIDISQRKQAEEALRLAKESAEQASTVKSRFLAHMSHELRTPMNGIIGLSLLAREGSPVNVMQDYLARIHDSATRLLQVINDILDFSRIEAGGFTLHHASFDLRSLVQDVFTLTELKARDKGLMLSCQMEPELPASLSGDGQRLKQILINLIDNAIKFTWQGSVTLRFELAPDPAPAGNIWLNCSVTDTGIGISANGLRQLFKPFSQLDDGDNRNYGGTGLGLVISSHLLQLMGGSAIEVTSTPDVGSTFSFRLPFKVAEASGEKDPAQTNSPGSLPRLDGCRVLVVEDNRINQLVAQTLLKRLGAISTLVENGSQAVDLLATRSDEFDVVLMDIQMPVMDGYTATQVIRQNLNLTQLPIIATTAHAMAEDRQQCLNAGMDAHIAKPMDARQLVEIITSLMYVRLPASPATESTPT